MTRYTLLSGAERLRARVDPELIAVVDGGNALHGRIDCAGESRVPTFVSAAFVRWTPERLREAAEILEAVRENHQGASDACSD